MPLSLTKRKAVNATVVDLTGRIVFGAECDLLRSEVKGVIGSQPKPKVILNLKEVEYVDSGGVGTLVGLYTSAKGAGGELMLVGANPRVQHVLEITKVVTVLGTYATEEKAVAALAS